MTRLNSPENPVSNLYPDRSRPGHPVGRNYLKSYKENAPVNPLLTPYKLGKFQLPHRMVLAPLIRCRAVSGLPHPAAAEHHSQRATGELALSEATCSCEEAHGYPNVPGIYTDQQIEAFEAGHPGIAQKAVAFLLAAMGCWPSKLSRFRYAYSFPYEWFAAA